jgi:NAD(P)-dependent dehydrogenase (short-subunit alcohol dehydrogenase family)
MAVGSVAVITGAGSGLGRELARALAARGNRLVLVGRRKECLLTTQAECIAAGLREDDVLVVPADITELPVAQSVVQDALDTFGRIDSLVNNAGLAQFAPILHANLGDLDRMLRTNFIGPVALIQQAIPGLQQTRGTIVNIGSIGGILALPGRALYGASKAALHHLTGSLARELAPDIRVNAVLPGAVDTEMYDNLNLSAPEVAALRAGLIASTPLGRMGTARDVVPWIEMLLGPHGGWVTGSLLVVDGGRSC